MIPIAKLETLPVSHRETIPSDYSDIMRHMNIRWYMALYDEATWKFVSSLGLDEEYYLKTHAGGFALKHFIQYLAEVRVGEIVAIRTRILGRSAKRLHFMHFMINETTNLLSSTMEALGTHADIKIRRSSPFPSELSVKIDSRLAEHQRLDWNAPVCGFIQP
ncbi:MAG: thioesterase family protein [Thermodesulfobacteriota bacterium]|nr:thioesterase family protein [Thermodesulfobacteriota bacterium]